MFFYIILDLSDERKINILHCTLYFVLCTLVCYNKCSLNLITSVVIFMAKKNTADNTLADNKKAWHDYFIEETYECGIELVGTEVKSIRGGRANLKDSYAEVRNSEIYACNIHISPYEHGNIYNVDPLRKRRLLLHKSEISKLIGYTAQQGYTLVPIAMYLKNRRVKVKLAVAKGKKDYDKRDSLKEKAAKRDIERSMKAR